MPYDSTFHTRLRSARGRLTQPDAAKILGMPLRTYVGWEGAETQPPYEWQREGAISLLLPEGAGYVEYHVLLPDVHAEALTKAANREGKQGKVLLAEYAMDRLNALEVTV